MKLLLFLSAFFLSAAATPTPRNPLGVKYMQLLVSEPPKTEAEASRLSCIGIYCHFEDKNGCKRQCVEFSKMYRKETPTDISKVSFGVAKNEDECRHTCIAITSSQAVKVCASLCANHFSYGNRAQYEQDYKDAMDELNRRHYGTLP